MTGDRDMLTAREEMVRQRPCHQDCWHTAVQRSRQSWLSITLAYINTSYCTWSNWSNALAIKCVTQMVNVRCSGFIPAYEKRPWCSYIILFFLLFFLVTSIHLLLLIKVKILCSAEVYKNSSGDEIANVNIYVEWPELYSYPNSLK